MRRVHAFDHVAEPEPGDDQRGVRLDVRAHDEDVARFERLVVGEQTEQNLAEHIDLAGGPVTAVHLHRAVGGGVHPPRSPYRVGRDVGLQPAEKGVRPVVAAQVVVGLWVAGQAALQFAKVTAEGGEQGMADSAVGGVFATGDLPVRSLEVLPEVVAGVGQP